MLTTLLVLVGIALLAALAHNTYMVFYASRKGAEQRILRRIHE